MLTVVSNSKTSCSLISMCICAVAAVHVGCLASDFSETLIVNNGSVLTDGPVIGYDLSTSVRERVGL